MTHNDTLEFTKIALNAWEKRFHAGQLSEEASQSPLRNRTNIPKDMLQSAWNETKQKGWGQEPEGIWKTPATSTKYKYLPVRDSNRNVAGFFSPEKNTEGFWRPGLMYMSPENRGRGLMAKALSAFFKNKPGFATVHSGNPASMKALENAGFIQSAPFMSGETKWLKYIKPLLNFRGIPK